MKISYIELKQYKYELSDDLDIMIAITGFSINHRFFRLTKDGRLQIFKGYKWDGVSGPMIDTDNTMIGGCVHDALYQMIRLGLLSRTFKSEADNIMKDIFDGCKMSEFRSYYAYLGVTVFGNNSCIVGDSHIPEVITLEC